MARYSLFIKPSAARELEAIPSKLDRQRLVRRILGLADNPRPPGHAKLSGQEKYRIRQGDYRVVYSIQDDRLVVSVIKLGHRKDIYR